MSQTSGKYSLEKETKGFSTGTAAAAAAVAAARFLQERGCGSVNISLPGGRELVIPITGCLRTEQGADAWVTRQGTDENDITHGAVIVSSVQISEDAGITVLGGRGVGVVTGSGFPVQPGKAAIAPGPMALIRKALGLELPEGRGALVTISIPQGEEMASKASSPRLGVVGGLPIHDSPVDLLNPDITRNLSRMQSSLSAICGRGVRTVCIVPGNYGRRMAMILGVPEETIVNIGNFVGEALSAIDRLGFQKVILVGQISKFAKLAAGSLDTHNARSDGRLEALAAYSALHGAASEDVRSILESSMTDEVATRISKTEWGAAALHELADRIVRIVMSIAGRVSECACLTFSLPDRELARTANLEMLIQEFRKASAALDCE